MPYLLGAGVDAGAVHAANDAAVTVAPLVLDDSGQAEAKAGKGLFRPLPVWLPLLRRVDLGEAYPVLLVVGIEHGQDVDAAAAETRQRDVNW